MTSAAHRRRAPRHPYRWLVTTRCGHDRLAYRLGQRDQIVLAGRRRIKLALGSDKLPAARSSQAPSVPFAQVVGVGLGEGGEGADDRGRVGVDIGQRGDGQLRTTVSRAPPGRPHVRLPFVGALPRLHATAPAFARGWCIAEALSSHSPSLAFVRDCGARWRSLLALTRGLPTFRDGGVPCAHELRSYRPARSPSVRRAARHADQEDHRRSAVGGRR